MPEYQRLEIERAQSAGFIYLNRPEKRNALDSLMVSELHDAVQELGGDDSVRSIVIAGRGKAFCAGADLAYLQQLAQFTALDNMADSASLARTLRAIYEVPKPVIARVHGPAIAGGCGLATVCDIVVAVEQATFGYTEVKIGFIPAIVMAFLVRKSQQMQTRELLLSGRIIAATEAFQRGLVTTVIPGNGEEAIAALDAHIATLTAEFAAASGSAITLTKQMLTALDGMPLTSALDYASRMNALARLTPDCQAGIAQFLNR
ncbi:MAG: enoyl-CoA hydratase/isomerase family protein [Chlorobi bacterium]|nr:MAG: Enoyl-CoA hydratase [Chlorobi bacterium OLB7]MBK8911770.1 enoyl-CoA hydratase/isomerase family protein [Chlorobiota bacterium]MBX7218117.1 enoyl-CoA hydratase/isomerase family protein [Candidatus Kapabacteria bacterium]